jgi:hypothetical protein
VGQWKSNVCGCACGFALVFGSTARAQKSIATLRAESERTALSNGVATYRARAVAASADSSNTTVNPPVNVQDALQAMCAAADIVFAGEVISIERSDSAVLVHFRVDDAVRGVTAGTYTLQEWPGLWAGNTTRYSEGQRLLMMLHAPSVAGFASPVAGGDGAIPLSGDAASGLVDLRWVAAHVAVTDDARLAPMRALRVAGGSLAQADALLASNAKRRAMPMMSIEGNSVSSSGASAANDQAASVPAVDSNAQVDRGTVMGLLHAWQRTEQAQ